MYQFEGTPSNSKHSASQDRTLFYVGVLNTEALAQYSYYPTIKKSMLINK